MSEKHSMKDAIESCDKEHVNHRTSLGFYDTLVPDTPITIAPSPVLKTRKDIHNPKQPMVHGTVSHAKVNHNARPKRSQLILVKQMQCQIKRALLERQ